MMKSNNDYDVAYKIIQLAKNNDPAFLGRFKEVYPEFCKSITEIYPDIKTSELIFCAYLKLNFSTKDIASYLFLLPKTIQNRKNRIRKKLNIPSEEDLYTWMDNLDRKSTRLNSSHVRISYAVFCLKKKKAAN